MVWPRLNDARGQNTKINYGLDTTGEKEKRTSKKNVGGRSTSSHDNKKFRTRSMGKHRGMAFGFRKTATAVKNRTDIYLFIFPHGSIDPRGPGPPPCRGFSITLRHIAPGRTPLDEWSARRRDDYLVIYNTHKWQISLPLAGFETAIPSSKRTAADPRNRPRGHFL